LAENLKKKIHDLEEKIDKLNKEDVDIQQKIQMEYNMLNNFQSSYVDQILKQDS
jgi:flagellar capping protein FliD